MRASAFVRVAGVAATVGVLVTVALWPETIAVDLAPVARADMEVTIDEPGQTRVRERFVVTAPVAGRLERLTLRPGDAVRRGEAIARLTPPDAPLLDERSRIELDEIARAASEAVEQARAERDRASVLLERASTAERRLANLVQIGGVSREDFDAAQTARLNAAAMLRAAEHAVGRTERELGAARARLLQPRRSRTVTPVRAPIDGIVLKQLRESESVVGASEALLEIADARQIEVVTDLVSSDAVRVREGDPVSIERWGGPQPIRGRVRRVEPAGFTKVSALGVEEQRVNVIVALDDAEECAKLGDGYRVEVRIAVWRAANVVTVPVGALFRHEGKWSVYAAADGRARLRTIAIGELNDMVAEVVDGLSPGDEVVLHPPDTITDGARIRRR